MKIATINVIDFLGVSRASMELGQITLVAGGNWTGKSSIQQAVRLALTGEPARVRLKGDYGLMCRDGAQQAEIRLQMADHGEAIIEVKVPAKKAPTGIMNPADASDELKCCLDPYRFLRATPDDRRKMAMSAVGTKIHSQDVVNRLIKRGIDKHRAWSIQNCFATGLDGFDAAVKLCESKASEARGAWKAITGEVYGTNKADAWVAKMPDDGRKPDVEALEAAAVDLRRQDDELSVAIFKAEAKAAAEGRNKEREQKLRREASKLSALTDRLAGHESMLAVQQTKVEEIQQEVANIKAAMAVVSMACPACEADLILDGGTLHRAHGYRLEAKREGDPALWEAERRLKQARDTLETLRRARDSTQAEVSAAAAAGEQLAAIRNEATPAQEGEEVLDAEGVEKARAKRLALAGEIRDAHHAAKEAREVCKAWDAAAGMTERAQLEHQEVLAWLALRDQCLPEGGVLSEFLESALGPLNKRLAQSATATGWAQPVVRLDGTILVDGRPLGLCSEAQEWCAGAMIAEAMAWLSSIKFVMLDRFDVLEPAHRITLVKWFKRLAEEGVQVLAFGTMKQPPAGLTGISVYWLRGGVLEEVPQEKKVAAEVAA